MRSYWPRMPFSCHSTLMASTFRLPCRIPRQSLSWRPLFQRPASPVRLFSQSNFSLLKSVNKLEEETLPWYSPNNFYPVEVGQIFESRYQVIGKLGYGGYSTVWLCRDLRQQAYVTVKVFERDSAEGKREIEIYEHLKTVEADHAGALLIRTALESFNIVSAEGKFQCLVHPPMGINLHELRHRFRARVLPENILKLTLLHILLALDFLHTEAGIVHADIKEKNIMLGIEDVSILDDFEQEEKADPSLRKVNGDRVIYSSRRLKRTTQHGRPVLCDFGQARLGAQKYYGDIQPYIYRAPEVILRMSWDQKVDIWNVGVLAWDLFHKGHLFYARDSSKQDSDGHHLAEMIALLGMPPKDMIQNSAYANNFFSTGGHWKGDISIPSISLEKLEETLEGAQQTLFLEFMRKMLKWRPEERESAKGLLSNPWLRSPSQ